MVLKHVKKFVMTSKSRHDVKNRSCSQKVRHDVTKNDLKFVMTSKTRHEVKNTSRSQKVDHDVKTRYDEYNLPWRQKHVMT